MDGKTVHVLMSSRGEYSDRTETVRGVFTDGAKARALAEELDARYRAKEAYYRAEDRIAAPFMQQLPWQCRKIEDVERIDEPFRTMRKACDKALAAFRAEHGPEPEAEDDTHWVVTLPVDALGRWDDCDFPPEPSAAAPEAAAPAAGDPPAPPG